MRTIIPSGRMKGRALEDLSKAEHHTLWAAWNGSPRLKASAFFQLILDDFARHRGPELPIVSRDRKVTGDSHYSPKSMLIERMLFNDPETVVEKSLPFGKHRGVPLPQVPQAYLEWCVENIDRMDVQMLISDELARRVVAGTAKASSQPKKSKAKRTPECNDDSATHYAWVDDSGFEHRIPNDVSMVGRELEICPF